MGETLEGTNLDTPITPADHASSHESGGGDPVDHDNLQGFVANEHIDWTNATQNLKTTGTAEVGELKMKVYRQASEPTLGATDFMAIWVNTAGDDKTYLIFRRGTGDQVSVELS